MSDNNLQPVDSSLIAQTLTSSRNTTQPAELVSEEIADRLEEMLNNAYDEFDNDEHSNEDNNSDNHEHNCDNCEGCDECGECCCSDSEIDNDFGFCDEINSMNFSEYLSLTTRIQNIIMNEDESLFVKKLNQKINNYYPSFYSVICAIDFQDIEILTDEYLYSSVSLGELVNVQKLYNFLNSIDCPLEIFSDYIRAVETINKNYSRHVTRSSLVSFANMATMYLQELINSANVQNTPQFVNIQQPQSQTMPQQQQQQQQMPQNTNMDVDNLLESLVGTMNALMDQRRGRQPQSYQQPQSPQQSFQSSDIQNLTDYLTTHINGLINQTQNNNQMQNNNMTRQNNMMQPNILQNNNILPGHTGIDMRQGILSGQPGELLYDGPVEGFFQLFSELQPATQNNNPTYNDILYGPSQNNNQNNNSNNNSNNNQNNNNYPQINSNRLNPAA